MLGLAFAVLNVSPFKILDLVTPIMDPAANQNHLLYLVMDCTFR